MDPHSQLNTVCIRNTTDFHLAQKKIAFCQELGEVRGDRKGKGYMIT